MSGWDLTRGPGTRLTIISAGRHRPYLGRPRGQACVHVQRPGRLDLGRHQEPGRIGQVDGTTFLFTITENAAKVAGLMGPAMDAVLTGKDASTLTETNEKVNALFK